MKEHAESAEESCATPEEGHGEMGESGAPLVTPSSFPKRSDEKMRPREILKNVAAAILVVAAFGAVLGFMLTLGKTGAEALVSHVHGVGNWAMVLMAAAFVALAIVDHVILLCRPRQPDSAAPTSSFSSSFGHGPFYPNELCPTCGERLVDGECPQGHTIVRCSKCSSVMRDGICPRCGAGGDVECCPICGSELADGECPRGHTIVRCPDCGSILLEGICPKGCNADPLNLVWPVGAEKKLGHFALRVVSCPKSEGQGFTLHVPESFVIGRSSVDAKEPFVELLTVSRKEKAQCSRQYVRFARDGASGAFTVTLLNSSRNPAFVDGKKLVMQNDTAPISLGGRIKLNPGYELELVQAPEESDSPSI